MYLLRAADHSRPKTMTDRSYADLRALSPSGKLRLECLSAENENEVVLPGVSTSSFGLQRHFRYQLIDTVTGGVLWERWQEDKEGSPVAARVSDDGYVVVRAHYLKWEREDLIFFALTGEKKLVVVLKAAMSVKVPVEQPESVSKKKLRQKQKAERRRLRANPKRFDTVVWIDPHIGISSARPTWARGSSETFVSQASTTFYSLRAGWGRRLIVDLPSMSLMPESLDAQLLSAITTEERKQAVESLQSLCQSTQESYSSWDSRQRILSALVLVIAHEMTETVANLRVLEGRPAGRSSNTSHVLTTLGVSGLRPKAQSSRLPGLTNEAKCEPGKGLNDVALMNPAFTEPFMSSWR
jgi:hypothetical protein